jgi:predicted ATPase/DNA-binding XRE family transcriptional regulator
MYAETTFGRWLRQRRRHLDLTQADLAERVGCSEITIRKIEADARTPSRQVAELLAACLNVPTAERPAFLAFARSLARTHPPTPPVPIAPAGPLAPLTRLLGRDADAAQIERRLLSDQVRLLNLTGPPGIGKTRLSLHVAELVRSRFADGVRFVALAPVRDPALVIPTLAQALGVALRAGQTPEAALSAALSAQQQLLVLDNFEQVVAAAPRIAELLQAAPRVKALVTSRATLNVSGEHIYAVSPLALPDPCALPPLDDLTCYPSIQLFVERVRAVRPDFMLTAENAPIVAAICARLDGLPLAIELAAARCKLFTPQALIERLRRPAGSGALSMLVNGPHDLLAHQRTLRGTLDWSYELLSRDEQAVLMRLAVFAGGCTLDAATAVLSSEFKVLSDGSSNSELRTQNSELSVLDLLASLLDKSLVHQASEPDGEARFTLLETIREYALDRLDREGGLDAARGGHAAYYAALARAAAPQLRGAGQERWLQRLHADYHNLRAALEWFADHDPEAGLRCAADLCQFWHMRSLLSEGRDWLARLLARCEADVCRAARAQALCAAGFLAYQQGDHLRAEQLSAESLALHRALGDRQGAVAALMNLGSVAFCRADYPRAIAIYDQGLALCRTLGDTGGIAHALRNLGLIAKDQGDLDRATLLLEQSLALYRQTGDTYGVARALFNLSTVAYWQGDYPRSGALAEQTAAICRELGDQMILAYALDGIGMAAYKQGDVARAAQHLEESLRLLCALDEKAGIALALHELGLIACAQGDLARAAQLLRDGLALAWRIGDRRRAAFCLEGLAVAWARRPLDAARLLGAAAVLREALGAPLPPAERPNYERTLATARAGAGPAAFAAAWEAGRMMPTEQVIGETLDSSHYSKEQNH